MCARGLLGCATGYASRSKRESGRRRSSPRLESNYADVQGVNVDGGRRRRNGVGEEAMWWCSEPADPPNRSVRVLRRFQGGSGRSGIAGGDKSGRRADIPAATSDTIPAAAGAVVEDSGHEGDPGARAELLRGFSGAVAWPGCWTAAAQCHDAAKQGGRSRAVRRRRLGLEAALARGMGSRGSAGWGV